MNRWVASLVRGCMVVGLMGAWLGCDPYGAYCEDRMSCMGGNDKDVEACIVEAEASEEAASLWDCDEYFDAAFECVESKARCENQSYRPPDGACDKEEEEYSACM